MTGNAEMNSPSEMAGALLSLETYLNPSTFPCKEPTISSMRRELAAGRLIVVRDAFVASFAERIHRSLDECTAWQMYEGYETHFHYRHHNLYKASDYPPDLTWCDEIFGSPATKSLAQALCGRECIGPTVLSASWYLPGDHSLPHTDAVASGAEANRQVAFAWHLTKHWRSEWGGAFFWCPKSIYLPPVFNTLVLFNVGPDTHHFVTEVSPYAQSKRLAVNGWWTGPAPTGAHVQAQPERLRGSPGSIEIY
jgi:Rps23 Pro-64 3,4-dihydroxylase Tpa1-like proline 4-hydroxylase